MTTWQPQQNASQNPPLGQAAAQDTRRDTFNLHGVVFCCPSHEVFHDCLRTGVFKLPTSQMEHISNVQPKMHMFLYNALTGFLHGIFKSVSSGEYNPSDQYDWRAQVRVEVVHNFPYLREDEHYDILHASKYPAPFGIQLDGVCVDRLWQAFARKDQAMRSAGDPGGISHPGAGCRQGDAPSDPRAEDVNVPLSLDQIDQWHKAAVAADAQGQMQRPPYRQWGGHQRSHSGSGRQWPVQDALYQPPGQGAASHGAGCYDAQGQGPYSQAASSSQATGHVIDRQPLLTVPPTAATDGYGSMYQCTNGQLPSNQRAYSQSSNHMPIGDPHRAVGDANGQLPSSHGPYSPGSNHGQVPGNQARPVGVPHWTSPASAEQGHSASSSDGSPDGQVNHTQAANSPKSSHGVLPSSQAGRWPGASQPEGAGSASMAQRGAVTSGVNAQEVSHHKSSASGQQSVNNSISQQEAAKQDETPSGGSTSATDSVPHSPAESGSDKSSSDTECKSPWDSATPPRIRQVDEEEPYVTMTEAGRSKRFQPEDRVPPSSSPPVQCPTPSNAGLSKNAGITAPHSHPIQTAGPVQPMAKISVTDKETQTEPLVEKLISDLEGQLQERNRIMEERDNVVRNMKQRIQVLEQENAVCKQELERLRLQPLGDGHWKRKAEEHKAELDRLRLSMFKSDQTRPGTPRSGTPRSGTPPPGHNPRNVGTSPGRICREQGQAEGVHTGGMQRTGSARSFPDPLGGGSPVPSSPHLLPTTGQDTGRAFSSGATWQGAGMPLAGQMQIPQGLDPNMTRPTARHQLDGAGRGYLDGRLGAESIPQGSPSLGYSQSFPQCSPQASQLQGGRQASSGTVPVMGWQHSPRSPSAAPIATSPRSSDRSLSQQQQQSLSFQHDHGFAGHSGVQLNPNQGGQVRATRPLSSAASMPQMQARHASPPRQVGYGLGQNTRGPPALGMAGSQGPAQILGSQYLPQSSIASQHSQHPSAGFEGVKDLHPTRSGGQTSPTFHQGPRAMQGSQGNNGFQGNSGPNSAPLPNSTVPAGQHPPGNHRGGGSQGMASSGFLQRPQFVDGGHWQGGERRADSQGMAGSGTVPTDQSGHHQQANRGTDHGQTTNAYQPPLHSQLGGAQNIPGQVPNLYMPPQDFRGRHPGTTPAGQVCAGMHNQLGGGAQNMPGQMPNAYVPANDFQGRQPGTTPTGQVGVGIQMNGHPAPSQVPAVDQLPGQNPLSCRTDAHAQGMSNSTFLPGSQPGYHRAASTSPGRSQGQNAGQQHMQNLQGNLAGANTSGVSASMHGQGTQNDRMKHMNGGPPSAQLLNSGQQALQNMRTGQYSTGTSTTLQGSVGDASRQVFGSPPSASMPIPAVQPSRGRQESQATTSNPYVSGSPPFAGPGGPSLDGNLPRNPPGGHTTTDAQGMGSQGPVHMQGVHQPVPGGNQFQQTGGLGATQTPYPTTTSQPPSQMAPNGWQGNRYPNQASLATPGAHHASAGQGQLADSQQMQQSGKGYSQQQTVRTDGLFIIGGYSNIHDKKMQQIERLHVDDGLWECVAKWDDTVLPEQGCAVHSKGKIYTVGGEVGLRFLFSPSVKVHSAEVDEVGRLTGKWKKQNMLLYKRAGHAAVAMSNGGMMVAGGLSPVQQQQVGGMAARGNEDRPLALKDMGPIDIVEVYDCQQDRWVRGPKLNVARYGLGITKVTEDVYFAVGGLTDGGRLSSTAERIDFRETSDAWTVVRSIGTPRAFFGCCSPTPESAMVIGGMALQDGSTCTITSSVEIFDFKTNQWQSVAATTEPRAFCTAHAIGNTVYAIGGLKFWGTPMPEFAGMEVFPMDGKNRWVHGFSAGSGKVRGYHGSFVV